MKAAVYSWRVSTDLKCRLEREARRRNLSLSAVLDLAACEWLDHSGAEHNTDDADEQRRLHEAASACLGAFAGNDPSRSENARRSVRDRIRAKRES